MTSGESLRRRGGTPPRGAAERHGAERKGDREQAPSTNRQKIHQAAPPDFGGGDPHRRGARILRGVRAPGGLDREAEEAEGGGSERRSTIAVARQSAS